MDISAKGDDLVWRASEIDKGIKCMRSLGYSRLGVDQAASGSTTPQAQVVPQYSWNLIAGSAMDDALCAYSEQQIRGRDPGTMNWEDYYASRLDFHYQGFSSKGIIVGDDTREEALREGTILLGIYHSTYGNVIHPVATQKEVAIRIPAKLNGEQTELMLVGHIDLVAEVDDPVTKLKHKVIWDWKFGKMKHDAATYERGWAYDLMDGDDSHHIGMISLRRGLAKPKIEDTHHFVTPAQHKQVVHQVRTVAQMYAAKYFPMTSIQNWWCSPKFCDAWSLCRGNPNGPARIVGEAV